MQSPRLIPAIILALSLAAPSWGREIQWSGRTWMVADSQGNTRPPGANVFSDSQQNVYVDPDGQLHLAIRRDHTGRWTAAEVKLVESLGYGAYEWQVASRYDLYPPNAVAGLFTYLSPEEVARQTGGRVGNLAPDTPHEIDIEMTRAWGDGNLVFTTHDPDVQSPTASFEHTPSPGGTTHRFLWTPRKITWDSYDGYVGDAQGPTAAGPWPARRDGRPVAHHEYQGPAIPVDLDERVQMNFWLYGEDAVRKGPSDGRSDELILKRFRYRPL